MVRVLTKAGFIVLMLFAVCATPASVAADTITVTQVITITATVAPARSIVVDDTGRMTSVVSNTDEPIVPKVYVNKVHGEERPLTPELKAQYDSIIAKQTKLNGIEIPVVVPQPVSQPPEHKLSFMSFINKLQATTGQRLPLL